MMAKNLKLGWLGLVVLVACLPVVIGKLRDVKVIDAKAGELRGLHFQWQQAGSPKGEAFERYATQKNQQHYIAKESFKTSKGGAIAGIFATTNLPGIKDSILLIDENRVIYFGKTTGELKQYWP